MIEKNDWRLQGQESYLAGVKRIFIPKDNARDIDKTDIAVRENV